MSLYSGTSVISHGSESVLSDAFEPASNKIKIRENIHELFKDFRWTSEQKW